MTREQVLVALFLALYLLVATVWATIGMVLWRLPRIPGFPRRLLPLLAVSALLAAAYVLSALFMLVPPAVHLSRPVWLRLLYVATGACFVGALAAFCHLTWCLPIGAPPPGRGRLAALYGTATMVLVFDATLSLTAAPPPALVVDTAVHGGWTWRSSPSPAGGSRVSPGAERGIPRAGSSCGAAMWRRSVPWR
jgi:hypothetical protein